MLSMTGRPGEAVADLKVEAGVDRMSERPAEDEAAIAKGGKALPNRRPITTGDFAKRAFWRVGVERVKDAVLMWRKAAGQADRAGVGTRG